MHFDNEIQDAQVHASCTFKSFFCFVSADFNFSQESAQGGRIFFSPRLNMAGKVFLGGCVMDSSQLLYLFGSRRCSHDEWRNSPSQLIVLRHLPRTRRSLSLHSSSLRTPIRIYLTFCFTIANNFSFLMVKLEISKIKRFHKKRDVIHYVSGTEQAPYQFVRTVLWFDFFMHCAEINKLTWSLAKH